MVISRWILLRMKNISGKVVEKIKTYIICSRTFFSEKSCLLWDNVEKYGRAGQASDDNLIRCNCFFCWISKTTDTHSECAIIFASPRQKWLRERASVLRWYVYCPCCYENREHNSLSYPNTALLEFTQHIQQDLKLQSKPDMLPLFVHRNSWGQIEIKYDR